MSMNEHRKDLLSLSQGRAKKRREMDGAVSHEVGFFARIAVDFNNEQVILKKSKGDEHLDSAKEMDPNGISMICLGRILLFFRNLYKLIIMGEYKHSTHK